MKSAIQVLSAIAIGLTLAIVVAVLIANRRTEVGPDASPQPLPVATPSDHTIPDLEDLHDQIEQAAWVLVHADMNMKFATKGTLRRYLNLLQELGRLYSQDARTIAGQTLNVQELLQEHNIDVDCYQLMQGMKFLDGKSYRESLAAYAAIRERSGADHDMVIASLGKMLDSFEAELELVLEEEPSEE